MSFCLLLVFKNKFYLDTKGLLHQGSKSPAQLETSVSRPSLPASSLLSRVSSAAWGVAQGAVRRRLAVERGGVFSLLPWSTRGW